MSLPSTRAEHVVVTAVQPVSQTATAFTLEPATPWKYQPGQYITVYVPGANDQPTPRWYSLASSPHVAEPVMFIVRRTPGGHGSAWLCDHINPGDQLLVEPPAGTFTPRSYQDDAILCAAGSGVVPLLSIAKSLVHNGSGRVSMLLADADERTAIGITQLRELQQAFPDRFALTVHYDHHSGLLDAATLRGLLTTTPDSAALYLCGPVAFMDLVKQAAISAGIGGDRIVEERFEAIPSHATATVLPTSTVQVIQHGQPTTYQVSTQEDLVTSLLSAGHPVPYSCREGDCSSCIAKLTDGAVHSTPDQVLTDADRASGYVVACCSRPASPHLVLDYDA